MKPIDASLRSTAIFALLIAAACGESNLQGESKQEDFTSAEAELISGRVGAVYTMSNDAISNEVIVFRRAADGSLQRAASHPTTGRGSGDGLGSQGALILSAHRRWLYAVSAGSNELSVFRVRGEALYLVDTIPTGGQRPVSVTEHDGLIYVVHAGSPNDISGFVQRSDGTLAPLPGSTRALSAPSVGPAQISFSPSGRALIVTEKGTSKIGEFRINANTGLPSQGVFHASNGQTPFGFGISGRGQVIVSEAFGGAPDASAVSSYQLGARAGLRLLSASVPNTEAAACWVVLAKGDRFAYVSNTASGTISAYTLAADGTLDLIGSDGRNADTGVGSRPLDMATSRGERYLYVLEDGQRIGVLRIHHDGSLEVLPDTTGLPSTSVGLAAQ